MKLELFASWELIDTGIGTAEWNMAVDEALLRNFKDGDSPIFRLYRWEESLSVGKFSNVERSVDLESLKRQNLACVRRMSGGGVLLHGGDLSYSLIAPRKLLKSKGVKESYRYLCGFLITLYEKLGYRAQFAGELGSSSKSSNICMASNEKYDILIGGKKMGGNAQRHTRKVLFQHGSVPLNMNKSRLAELFLEESGADNVATLRELGCSLKEERLAQTLIEAVVETFGVETVSVSLTHEQLILAKELLKNKYAREEWNSHAKQNSSQA